MVRVSYQQFPYQQPPFNDTARMRPMYERSYAPDKFQLINKALVDQLLGTDVETYTDLAPFFLAAVMSNEGKFDPGWFEQENFAPLNAVLPPEHALRVFDLMREDPAYFRSAARNNRSQHVQHRQYDFNPFAAKPFVNLPGRGGPCSPAGVRDSPLLA